VDNRLGYPSAVPPTGAYPPIGDYALIGDCHTAALVSRQASIEWCCLPRFDSGSAFARMLDRERGGHCSITPTDAGAWEYSRRYLDDTLVLETTLRGPAGEARVIDCFAIREDARSTPNRRIIRVIEGSRGSVELEVRVAPRFDYGQVRPWIRRHGHRMHSTIGGNDALLVWFERELAEDPEHELVTQVSVGAGDRVRLVLDYCPPEMVDARAGEEPDTEAIDAMVERTVQWWREWASGLTLGTRDEPGARRSGITLKALTHDPTGAIVAAPTTSLPEVIGGERNWDYRFAWVRDASFSSRAFAELGAVAEADAFRTFMMRSAAGYAGDLQVLYGAGGERRLRGVVLDDLEGYRRSAPVRAGNDATAQRQLDAYGELVNLTWRWHRRGHSPSDDDWRFIVSLIDLAAEQWSEPDYGLWEWPSEPDHFVHSKVMCWAALDRGMRLADECMRRAPTRRWKRVRDEIREAVDEHGYDADRGIYVQAFGRPELDAALLLLPTVEYVAWDDERMVRTASAVREELHAGEGLLYRYTRKDGLPGREGAFLCCTFWLVENLARAGDPHDARTVYDKAMGRANDLGLFSEEIDPQGDELLGNFPQGLTHLAQIDAAVTLAEVERGV
jgi:GH15 family glucan-1,4-alpha-glucosidase